MTTAASGDRRLLQRRFRMAHHSDNAWKGILRGHFKDCLRFLFPAIHDGINWRTKLTFLDKELEKLAPAALKGKALADKLVQVRLRTGRRLIVFLHVEVQGWRDPTFTMRMFRYNVLLRERYGNDVVSLAVLTDGAPRYRPNAYTYELWGFSLRMIFPVVKLLDFKGREEELASRRNPFAIVVLAHLAKLEARGLEEKLEAKLRLVRLLCRRGYTRQEIQDLLRFLDWILCLPEELERRIIDVTATLEHGKRMRFLSNIERWSLQKGRREGREKGRAEGKEEGKKEGKREGLAAGLYEAIAISLEHRFGAHGLALLPRIREIGEAERLLDLLKRLQTARSLTAFRTAVGKGS